MLGQCCPGKEQHSQRNGQNRRELSSFHSKSPHPLTRFMNSPGVTDFPWSFRRPTQAKCIPEACYKNVGRIGESLNLPPSFVKVFILSNKGKRSGTLLE